MPAQGNIEGATNFRGITRRPTGQVQSWALLRESLRRSVDESQARGQAHAKVMPGISEHCNEARRRGVQQGVIVEEAGSCMKSSI